MTINGTTNAPGMPGYTPPTTTTAAPDALGKDAFLKLLVAQLKYQDPLNPAEGSEFMAQTAQFTMVEKLEEIARQGAELLAGQRLAAAGLVGREVSYTDEDGKATKGEVESVRFGSSGTVLVVGGKEVPFASVTEVHAPGD